MTSIHDKDHPFRVEVRALRERAGEAVRAAGATGRGTISYSREHYEIACEAIGVAPLTDERCESHEVLYGYFEPPQYDAQTAAQMSLARLRGAGLMDERRTERQRFRAELERQYPMGLTREGYEAACAKAGVEPAPDEQARDLNALYQQRMETDDLVPINVELGALRYSAIMAAKRPSGA